MPYVAPTPLDLSDLLVINGSNVAFDVNELLQGAPVFAKLFKQVASDGTVHRWRKETGAPNVGFRTINTGRVTSSSTLELVSQNLTLLDASFKIDQGLTLGAKGGTAAVIADEARRHLRESFKHCEYQFFRPDNDALGFTAFPESTGLQYLGDDYVFDAEGTGEALTSAYIIRTAKDGVSLVLGSQNAGDMAEIVIGETVAQEIQQVAEDGTLTGASYPGWYTPILGWLTLQIGAKFDVVRIVNLDAADAKLTDDLLFEAWSLFPEDHRPTPQDGFVAMNKRSANQLRASRTATNTTGAPSPWPNDWSNLPIVETSAIEIGEDAVVEEGGT